VKDGPFLERIGLPHSILEKRAIGMYHITGFDRNKVIDLCVLINSAEPGPDSLKWPPILGLFKSVTVTLAYIRHNRTQAEIGESFGVSQPTISRAIKVILNLSSAGQLKRERRDHESALDPLGRYFVPNSPRGSSSVNLFGLLMPSYWNCPYQRTAQPSRAL